MSKKQNQDNAPLMTPPVSQETNVSSLGGTQPTELNDSGIQEEQSSSLSSPIPEVLAQQSSYQDEGFGAGTWHNNKKVTALWSINESRNAWAAVTDLGWKKLANNSDSVVTALNLLASHARDRDRAVNVRVDNNQIVEIYVW